MTAPNQLGEFLRARRSRLQPSDVGLPSGVGLGRRGDRKPFRHPQVGEFTLTFEVLYLEGGQRMTIYQAEPGSRDHDAMTLLSMIASGEQTPGRLPSPGRPPA
jgi:hypothetical protein